MNTPKIIRLCFFLTIVILPFISNGKSARFMEFYDKYKGSDDFTCLSIKPAMLPLFLAIDDRDIRHMLKHIRQMKVLVFDGNAKSAKSLDQELKDNYLDNYDDLLAVQDGSDNVSFKVHMEGNAINELVMVVNDPGSLVVIYLQGKIEMSEVKKLSQSVSKNGSKNTKE